MKIEVSKLQLSEELCIEQVITVAFSVRRLLSLMKALGRQKF